MKETMTRAGDAKTVSFRLPPYLALVTTLRSLSMIPAPRLLAVWAALLSR